MTVSEKQQYLRREHGLNDEQITAVMEDFWEDFWAGMEG